MGLIGSQMFAILSCKDLGYLVNIGDGVLAFSSHLTGSLNTHQIGYKLLIIIIILQYKVL